MKGFALGLALKQRRKATRKSSIKSTLVVDLTLERRENLWRRDWEGELERSSSPGGGVRWKESAFHVHCLSATIGL